jgi:hypothetical protein
MKRFFCDSVCSICCVPMSATTLATTYHSKQQTVRAAHINNPCMRCAQHRLTSGSQSCLGVDKYCSSSAWALSSLMVVITLVAVAGVEM